MGKILLDKDYIPRCSDWGEMQQKNLYSILGLILISLLLIIKSRDKFKMLLES